MHDLVKRDLESYLSGTPTPDLVSHLAECERCAAIVHQMASLSETLRTFRRKCVLQPSADFTVKVQTYIEARENQGVWTFLCFEAKALRQYALVAMSVVASCVGFFATNQPGNKPLGLETLFEHDLSIPSDNPEHMEEMFIRLAKYDGNAMEK